MTPVPITSDLAGYQAFWSYWFKVAVVLVSLWGVVLEGTLLAIRRELAPCPVAVAGPSFASVMVRAMDLQ